MNSRCRGGGDSVTVAVTPTADRSTNTTVRARNVRTDFLQVSLFCKLLWREPALHGSVGCEARCVL